MSCFTIFWSFFWPFMCVSQNIICRLLSINWNYFLISIMIFLTNELLYHILSFISSPPTQYQGKCIYCTLRVISSSHLHWGCIFFELELALLLYSLLKPGEFIVVILVPRFYQNRKRCTANVDSMHGVSFQFLLSHKLWPGNSLISCHFLIFH